MSGEAKRTRTPFTAVTLENYELRVTCGRRARADERSTHECLESPSCLELVVRTSPPGLLRGITLAGASQPALPTKPTKKKRLSLMEQYEVKKAGREAERRAKQERRERMEKGGCPRAMCAPERAPSFPFNARARARVYVYTCVCVHV